MYLHIYCCSINIVFFLLISYSQNILWWAFAQRPQSNAQSYERYVYDFYDGFLIFDLYSTILLLYICWSRSSVLSPQPFSLSSLCANNARTFYFIFLLQSTSSVCLRPAAANFKQKKIKLNLCAFDLNWKEKIKKKSSIQFNVCLCVYGNDKSSMLDNFIQLTILPSYKGFDSFFFKIFLILFNSSLQPK